MANPVITFLKAIMGQNPSNVSKDEIKKAEQAGAIAARNAAKRMGIVEQVDVDAEAARNAAQAKAKSAVEKDGERSN